MLDSQQKRKVRGVMYHRATLVTLFIIALFFIHSTWVVYQKKRASEEVKIISMQNLDTLDARDKDLQAKINRLQTSQGVEEEIRSRFSVAKVGESMVVVVDNDTSTTSTTTPSLGFWQRFKDFLFK